MDSDTQGGEPAPKLTLYSRYESDCSARLRIAMRLKGLEYDCIAMDTTSSTQRDASYAKLNPSKSIPTLVVENPGKETIVITQSVAALEYLEETFPASTNCKGLLPLDSPSRAVVRSLVNVIATDTHPLTAARTSRAIRELFPCPETEHAVSTGNIEWDAYWLRRGLEVYEATIKRTAGRFSVGDTITMADVCLIPAVWTAVKFGVVLDEFPTVKRVADAMEKEPAVREAHWRCQPDTPEDARAQPADL